MRTCRHVVWVGRSAWVAVTRILFAFLGWWGRERYGCQSLRDAERFYRRPIRCARSARENGDVESIRRHQSRVRSIGQLSVMPRRELVRAWLLSRRRDISVLAIYLRTLRPILGTNRNIRGAAPRLAKVWARLTWVNIKCLLFIFHV